MDNAKNTKNPKNESKVKKGEELLAVLTEILHDNSKILQRLDDLEEMVQHALPPSPGRFTRM